MRGDRVARAALAFAVVARPFDVIVTPRFVVTERRPRNGWPCGTLVSRRRYRGGFTFSAGPEPKDG
jgi:hypothetical protein